MLTFTCDIAFEAIGADSDNPLENDVRNTSESEVLDRLHALQAAYCMILLQTWEGSEESKRRARRSRYTDIIGVLRSVCSDDLIHWDVNMYIDSQPSAATWKDFAVTEEMIRTTYAYSGYVGIGFHVFSCLLCVVENIIRRTADFVRHGG